MREDSLDMEDRAGSRGCECDGCDRVRRRIIEQLERLGERSLQVSKNLLFSLEIGGEELVLPVDLLVFDGGRPVLLVECVAGHLVVRERAALSKARLLPGGPVPLVMVANEADAVVVEVERGKEIAFGVDGLTSVLDKGFDAWRNPPKPSPETIERERRVLAAYGNLGCGGGRDLS
jgi:hypothetical protein